MVKTIMFEKKIFDTEILKVGQKIHFGFKYIDDSLYDEGDGEILQVYEDEIYLYYKGHGGEMHTSTTPEQIADGSNILIILK